MKYLVYCSETKLSMLEPQITKTRLERILSKIKPELGFEKFGFKAKVSADGIDGGDSMGRIDKIVEEIKSKDKIGTIETPKSWFSGSLKMKWCVFSDYATDLVMFSGISETTLVCLIGSVHSLVGWSKGNDVNHSINYYTLKFMHEVVGREPPIVEVQQSDYRDYYVFMQAVDSIRSEVSKINSPAQDVEFVAPEIVMYSGPTRFQYYHDKRRLAEPQAGDIEFSKEELDGITSDVRLLIGSPLYVALQD